MFESVFSIPLALIVLSFLIFVHELAHFVAGKMVGIHADVFSIGFGPALFRVQRGTTEYRISAIPAGGYVKFPGEYAQDGDERLEGEYYEASVWRRMVVVVAGPVSNLILGAVMLAALAASGMPEKTKPMIGEVVRASGTATTYWDDPTQLSPAAIAGIEAGDEIVAVGGREVATWEQFTQEIFIRPGQETTLTVVRDGTRMELAVTPKAVLRGKMTVGQIGVAARQLVAVSTARDPESSGAAMSTVAEMDGQAIHGFGPFRRMAGAGSDVTATLRLSDQSERRVRIRSQVRAGWDETTGALSELEHIGGDATVVAVGDVSTFGLDGLRRELLTVVEVVDGSTTLTLRSADGTTAVIDTIPNLDVAVTGVDGSAHSAVDALRLGDRLVAVESLPMEAYDDVRAVLQAASAEGRTVRMTFERRSELLFLDRDSVIDVYTPVHFEDSHVRIPGLSVESNYAAGRQFLSVAGITFFEALQLVDADSGAELDVGFAEVPVTRYGPIGAVVKGTAMTGTMVAQTLSFLGRLITGEVSTVHVSGPVGIVKYTQATIVRGGFSVETVIRILSLMALISVNLAVVNLLPIPIADGGQMLFFLFEGIRGRPMAVKWQVGIQQVSVLVLIGLFALVTLKDLVYW